MARHILGLDARSAEKTAAEMVAVPAVQFLNSDPSTVLVKCDLCKFWFPESVSDLFWDSAYICDWCELYPLDGEEHVDGPA